MLYLRRPLLLRYLLLSAILALLFFISSFWLPQGSDSDCGSAWQPCLSFYRQTPDPPLDLGRWAEPDDVAPPLTIRDCPGRSFQARRLLLHLTSCLEEDGDVLLDAYLQSWDQLLRFMESLGAVVGFFSQKVSEKVLLIRQLSLKYGGAEAHGKPADPSGLSSGAYRSVRAMVGAELRSGRVDFSRRSDSGCRTLLRLHRSLLWVRLLLEGLREGPGTDGRFRTPGELSRDAYLVALAPHHSWFLRRAAELVFLALPDRKFFLQLVCVDTQREADPVLQVLIQALKRVHSRIQKILAEHQMLELP